MCSRVRLEARPIERDGRLGVGLLQCERALEVVLQGAGRGARRGLVGGTHARVAALVDHQELAALIDELERQRILPGVRFAQ